jgi:hypothetical protein
MLVVTDNFVHYKIPLGQIITQKRIYQAIKMLKSLISVAQERRFFHKRIHFVVRDGDEFEL